MHCTRMWNWSRLVDFSPYSLYYKHLRFYCYGYNMSDGLLRWKLLFLFFEYNPLLFINKCEIAVQFLNSFRQEKAAHSLKDANLLFRLLNSTLHSVNMWCEHTKLKIKCIPRFDTIEYKVTLKASSNDTFSHVALSDCLYAWLSGYIIVCIIIIWF